jgi:hypothetical protein
MPTRAPLPSLARVPSPPPKLAGPVNLMYSSTVWTLVGPVLTSPLIGCTPGIWTPLKRKLRPVRSSGPPPVATTFGPSCKSVTTYAACADGSDRPINIPAPSAAAPSHFGGFIASPEPVLNCGVYHRAGWQNDAIFARGRFFGSCKSPARDRASSAYQTISRWPPANLPDPSLNLVEIERITATAAEAPAGD